MRICLISREYPPDTGWGGIGTFAKHLAHGLADLDHTVEVVSLTADDHDVHKTQGTADCTGHEATTIVDGIPVHRVSPTLIPGDLGATAMFAPYSRSALRTSTALWTRFFQVHKENPFDVVDAPELLAEGLYPALTKVLPLTIRLYTPHSKFIAERLHNISPSFDHQLVATLERVAMLLSDAITSPSHDLAGFVAQDLSYPRQNIKIVRNPIDTDLFTQEGPKAILPHIESSVSPIVLFVGRLEERKGIHYLINALPQILSECPDVRLVIIGTDTTSGSNSQSVLKELMSSLSRSRCKDKVTFIPHVELTQLPQYYRLADVCVVPSVYDNSPYTCLEAMACGKAVIGTSSGGTSEYIVHGESGLIIQARDQQAIAGAVIHLLNDPQERLRLGNNARSRVLKEFRRQEIARQMLDVYQLAIENFAVNKQHALYRKPPEEALPEAASFLYSLDKAIYNMLYVHSLRFRLRHCLRLLLCRPRLQCAKLFVRVIKPLLGWLNVKSDSLKHLEEEIRQLDEERERLK